ncbi:hypothetical protein [Rhodobacter aestuarii]|uniref:hypothetical protein n=1 Tax=Rhodobacter aestuarii TaxID=453582 RepID=UPI0011157ACB|nr:hypothetical protein [Rhodobacter aestuarii]
MAAKAKKFIMRGRGVETGLIVEAAAQKFFESNATYRMERRLSNSNINLSRQAIGRNIAQSPPSRSSLSFLFFVARWPHLSVRSICFQSASSVVFATQKAPRFAGLGH